MASTVKKFFDSQVGGEVDAAKKYEFFLPMFLRFCSFHAFLISLSAIFQKDFPVNEYSLLLFISLECIVFIEIS